MKKLLLIFILQTGLQAQEIPKRCSDSVYAIIHQSCRLTFDIQKLLLKANDCTTINEDSYFFYFENKRLEYNIETCSFKN